MKTFIFMTFAFAIVAGITFPSSKPAAPASVAAHTGRSGLFEPSPYKETQLRRQGGHFFVTADINGAQIRFLVDTGASAVALTEADARAVGLQFSSAEFEPVARTANGVARGKFVTLPKVSIEGKDVTEVDAMIVEDAGISLLGQSYLARITGVQMNGDTMVLR
jgi:aspartyl protease family protein